MATLIEEIKGFEEHISRPVAFQIIDQLKLNTNIPLDTPIRYTGNGGALALPNSTLHADSKPNRLEGDSNISISVSESFDESRALTTAISRTEMPTEFADNDLGIYLKPYKNRVIYNIEITLTCKDKTTAQTWYNTVKRKFSQGVNSFEHKVDYHYPIPQQFMFLLGELYKIRQNKYPINETVGQWLKRCFSNKMVLIADNAGGNQTFVIKESQYRIMGYFDFDANPPLPEKPNDSGVWSVSFNYTYDYDRPDGMVMDYPIMIHNQIIPDDLRPPTYNNYITNIMDNPGLVNSLLREFEPPNNIYNDIVNIPGLPIPIFDDWLTPYTPNGTVNIIRALIEVDENHPKSILNLQQLGNYQLPQLAVDYLKDEPYRLFIPGDSVFNGILFNKNRFTNSRELIITPDLDINNSVALNPRNHYHFVLYMVTALTNLSTRGLLSLTKHGYFAIYYLITLYPKIAEIASDTITLPDGTIVVIGDPNNRPTSIIAGGVKIVTIRMPDGDIIQSTILPPVRPDGTIDGNQLITVIRDLTSLYPFATGLNTLWRLVGNFVVRPEFA